MSSMGSWVGLVATVWLSLNTGCGGDAVVEQGSGGASSSSTGGSTECGAPGCEGAYGNPEVIASGQAQPIGIAIDQDHVYWTNMLVDYPTDEAGTIMRVSKSGGPVTKLADQAPPPLCAAVDDAFVYWGSEWGGEIGGDIARVPKEGGETESLFADISQILSVAVAGGVLYATRHLGVVRVGTSPPHVAELFKEGTDGPLLIAADSEGAYWSGHHGIMKISKDGSEPIPLYQTDDPDAEMGFWGIAVDQDRVYFSSWLSAPDCAGASRILSVPKAGGAAVTIASSPRPGVSRMVVDDSFVYWTEWDEGRVMRVSKGGGEPEVIACGQALPRGIAVDEAFVYWANGDSGTIMRAAK